MDNGNGLKVEVARLYKLEGKSSVKAFADIVLNESLLLKGIRVIEGKSGVFVSMPREKGKDNRWYETIHPMTIQVKDEICDVVLSAYNK